MVIPAALRDEISSTPGDVIVHRTADGLLLTPAPRAGSVGVGGDGLPVLHLELRVTNDEVLAAIDHDRSQR